MPGWEREKCRERNKGRAREREMGKAGGATPARKKKGRPSLVDLKKRALEEQELQNYQQSQRRSTRRNPNSATTADDASADEDEYYEDDDDDERKEKKVKLVVRLPQLNQQPHLSSDLVRSSSLNSASYGSDSNADVDNRKINSGSGGILTHHQGGKVPKAMDTLHGSPLEAGPTTPLPDKKLLVFILDRLQKKDTHAVFSEPVDPDELPDYHEIIEQPMDFGTVRSKLDKGLYSNLEELETDVYLICSNAMQYNPSDTVFFRQARSIQELAKRDFENLRQEGEGGELQPKVVRRGRPPSKHLKKPPGRPPLDASVPESTSGATLATPVDNNHNINNESTPYNLRRGPTLYPSYRTRNGDHHSEISSDWNEEFPANIRRADMKYGNKHFIIDESRRDTYKEFHPSNYAQNHSLLSNFGGERKQLLAVGLHAEHGYARSLARFASNMGPIVWKIASKKIEKALPPGVTIEHEYSPLPTIFPPTNQNSTPKSTTHNLPNNPETPSTSGPVLPKIEDSIRTDKSIPPQNGRNGLNISKMGIMFQGTTGHAQGTNRQFMVPVPPDLNVGASGSIGSPQQPDLALQL
ncbi:hypothetical protein L2E82_07764 [Cichorium intybus]|uniref:Uncharacterized protein n=1 Tax=Cichorium intybus TaxID=13427 RepID=A0ACB9G5T7_CICIN|nr:hypothetical protein L2E82_07764 [Cichorium intybus]